MFAKISLQNCPGLARLLKEGEDLSDLMALSPEEILLRWFNYHLEEAGHPRRVNNFSKDIMVTQYNSVYLSILLQDSECYTILLNQIAPDDSGVDLSPLQVSVT